MAIDRGTDHPLRLGLYLSQIEHIDGCDPSMVPEMARIAEDAGIDDIFLREHIARGLVARLVTYGSGFCPLFVPTDDDVARLEEAFAAVGRSTDELEMVSTALPVFTDRTGPADFDASLPQIELFANAGITTFLVGAGGFVGSRDELPSFCDHVVRRFEQLRG